MIITSDNMEYLRRTVQELASRLNANYTMNTCWKEDGEYHMYDFIRIEFTPTIAEVFKASEDTKCS
jgi:muconolactone delta-isomerase